jgi:hypothetical protein
MSTLVSLVLAAVLNFLGAEIPPEVNDATVSNTYEVEIKMCDEHSELLASTCIIKSEQLFKEKGIR